MKIVLNSMQDVTDFLSMFKPEILAHGPVAQTQRDTARSLAVGAVGTYGRKDTPVCVAVAEDAAEPTGLPADIAAPRAGVSVEATGPSLPEVAALTPDVDATGRKWNERIDSSNKGLNADGTWRARRNHGLSAEEVAAIKADMMVDEKGNPERDPEPEVTTETHPLPVQEPGPESSGDAPRPADTPESQEPAAALELDEVLIRGAELADDAPDGHMDVLNASRSFISAFDLDVYNAIKAATVEGKALQTLMPAERRLLIGTLNAYTEANQTPDAS